MSLYQTVKSAITVRQVGEMYGMEPDRHGMVCCPFHSDSEMCIRDSHITEGCMGNFYVILLHLCCSLNCANALAASTVSPF